MRPKRFLQKPLTFRKLSLRYNLGIHNMGELVAAAKALGLDLN